jgi:CHASE3 domain sensor protein
LNLVRVRDSFNLVEHTNEVLRQISTAEVGLFQAESSERGWVLSGDASYLETYRQAVNLVTSSLRALNNLIDTGEQRRRLQELQGMIDARLNAFARIVELGPARRDEALAILASERGRQSVSRITKTLEAMRRVETDLLAQREKIADRAAVYRRHRKRAGVARHVWRLLRRLPAAKAANDGAASLRQNLP